MVRLVIQRVAEASVSVEGKTISQINQGLMVLLGVNKQDTWKELETYANKVLKIRLWNKEEEGKESKSWGSNVVDNQFEILVVSQFTLYGTLKKGPKPDFHNSMGAEEAKLLYEKFVEKLKKDYKESKVQTGQFQAHMKVQLVNDGPVTIVLDSDENKSPKPDDENKKCISHKNDFNQLNNDKAQNQQ